MPLFNDQSFNDTLTNDSVSFEQLGPEFYIKTDKSEKEKRLEIKHVINTLGNSTI